MEKDMREEIIELIKELPGAAQRAVYWIIENFDFVTEMCKSSAMTYEEVKKSREKAIENKDYLMLALLYLAETYKN